MSEPRPDFDREVILCMVLAVCIGNWLLIGTVYRVVG